MLCILGAVLMIGAIKYLLDLKQPGVFPPKQVLKKRAIALAGSGGLFLLMAFLFSSFQ